MFSQLLTHFHGTAYHKLKGKIEKDNTWLLYTSLSRLVCQNLISKESPDQNIFDNDDEEVPFDGTLWQNNIVLEGIHL